MSRTALILARALASLWLLAVGTLASAGTLAPATPTIEVTDTYHGVAVKDKYRWLENAADPKVHDWSGAQDARTRAYLEGLPQRASIYRRLYDEYSATSSSYYGVQAVEGQFFAYFNQPPKQQPMIALLANDADPARARIIVDPNAMDPSGTTAIDWFVPSPDGKLLAVSLSKNGSEDGTLHVFEVATGKEVGEAISRVQYPTAGGSLAWRADAKGFWYTRYPGPDSGSVCTRCRPEADRHFYQQLYFHEMGTPVERDRYVLGKDFPKVAEIALENRANRSLVVVSVANGDGGEFMHYVISPDASVHQVTQFRDRVVAVTAGADGTLYLLSRKDAPRGKLLTLAPHATDLEKATVLIPQSEAIIQNPIQAGAGPMVVTPSAIYLREIAGGPSRVGIYDHGGQPRGALPLPDISTLDDLAVLSDGSILYAVDTYLRPPYFERYDERSAKASETKLLQRSPVSFDDTEVLRKFVKSKDGTAVPINIVRRKGSAQNGATPCLLTGYGGYNISLTPQFLGPDSRLWLDAGAILVIANLRGGGEYGESWHEQGALTHKQNVFDDFIASAEYLIKERYTDAAHLAILGGSNGGLLMGAAFTQHPELFRAVVSKVGVYDMLRVELDPNGQFNATEYGSVKDRRQFDVLYAYSPYHHVKDGTPYPAIFMATGEMDGRVNPAHSRKMIARLQAASSSGRPIYLSIESHAGHGIGSALSIRVNQKADVDAFLFDQLGMKFPAH